MAHPVARCKGFYSILFYSILFYSILFYSILFYSILFYSILFYSILFYSILIFYSASAFGSILARWGARITWVVQREFSAQILRAFELIESSIMLLPISSKLSRPLWHQSGLLRVSTLGATAPVYRHY